MADLKLVGAVAIKVRPDADGFRRDAQKQLDKEAKDLNAEAKLKVNLDSKEAKEKAEKLAKEEDGRTITWNVKLDRDAIRGMQRTLDQMKLKTKEVEFDLDDKGSIKRAEKKLQKMLEKAKVRITYSDDEQGYQQVLDRIAKIRREKLEKKIKFKTDDATLDKWEKEFRDKIDALTPEVQPIKQTVDIEYHEDREGFKAAIDRINSELRKLDALHLDVELNRDELIAARDMFQEQMDKEPLIFKYVEDEAGYKKILKDIEALQRKKLEIPIDLNLSDAELAAKHAEIQAKLDALPVQQHVVQEVTFKYNNDRAGLEKLIKEIDAKIREIDQINLTVELDKDKLLAERAIAEAALAKLPTKIEYNNNVASIRKAIAEVKTLLDKERYKLSIETTLDEKALLKTKAKLERQLGRQKIHIEYETDDLSSLKAARAQIMALLPIEHKTHLTTKLDEASLLKALAEIDEMIKAATPKKIEPKVKPKLEFGTVAKVFGEIKALTKSQTVDIFVKVNNLSILTAAAKLTGLRAATKWSEAFAKSLGSLDRNLPIVAAVVVGLNSMTSGILTLTAAAFSLGNGLGEVVRMGALLGPAMILGFAAAKTVFTGVFKDFGAAVNGDKTAIKKLTESGKEAAANMRVIFQDMREAISNNFWDRAGDSMLRFTKTALPAVKNGMQNLATSMGGVFSSVVDAFSTFADQNGIDVFFTNLIRGFDNVKNGMAPFMSAFLNLAALGSTIFPRMGKGFEAMSEKFDAWVNGLASDGTFSRWIDQGVQGIKDLWSASVNLVKIWADFGRVAQGAGALTLHSFAGAMAKLEEVTSSYRFQDNLLMIFRGAREASDAFHDSLKSLGPVMDVFAVTVHNALANSGQALASFVNLLGDILSSSALDKGLTAFLGGVKKMFDDLRPAAAPVAAILGTLGEILGQIASDSGPLFRTLFTQISVVLTTAWHALEPFLPGLIQVGTTIVGILGPALAQAANVLLPAFGDAVTKIGTGLIPVIQNIADFAAGFAGWVSTLPIDVVVSITTGIIALSGAMQFASTVLPILGAALEVFGVTAALTGARLQLMIPVIGIALAAITGLAIGGIAQMASEQKSAAPYANEYATALAQDAAEAKGFGDAIGKATTKLAIQKLMASGVYDAAHQLGIGYGTVTEAVIKGGPALDALKSKLDTTKQGFKDHYLEVRKSGAQWDDFKAQTKGDDLGMQAIETVTKGLEEQRGSLIQGQKEQAILATVSEQAGTNMQDEARKTDLLTEALKKLPSNVGAASAATSALTDAFSSSSSKIDAMRKTFEILLGKDAKQSAAETLGEYAKGFQDLQETVTPLAGKMQELGDAIYGDGGFLNIAGGNKVVMQVNQALVDQVNNTWAGAKAVYDQAVKQGKNAQDAMADAQQFINDRHGDFNKLAEESGVDAARVQGQWDAVFGHPWVLEVSLNGATEAATRAQEMITALKGQFDGKKFTAWLDANPDMALLAIQDPVAAADAYVNHEWKAVLDALPGPAKEQLQNLKGLTEDEWNRGDFKAILRAAQQIPGLPEALVQIRNGASNSGKDWQAIIFAITNNVSLEAARNALDEVAKQRTAYIKAVVDAIDARSQLSDLNGDASGNGRPGVANGGIFRTVQTMQDLLTGKYHARMDYRQYANGGIERHVAQIASGRGPVRIWGEPETQGEAYVPLAKSKRPRSLAILNQVAKEFGYTLTKNAQSYAAGGLEGHASPTNTTNASVSIGTLYTTDPDEAVRKIRNSQVDALAVAGITLNGA